MELKHFLMRLNPTKMCFLVSILLLWNHSKKRVWEGISEKINAVSSVHLTTIEEFLKKKVIICQRYENENFPKSKRSCQNKRVFGSSPPDWTTKNDHRNYRDCIIRGVPGDTCGDITSDNICSGSTPWRSHLPGKNIYVTNIEIWFNTYKH